MAFAFIIERNFELGDDTDWDTKTDTDTALAHDALDFPSYREMARYVDSTMTPYTGAYCMRNRLGGNTADATLTEADGNLAAGVNNFWKFEVWFSGDFTGTADDTVPILQIQDTGNAVHAVVGFRIVAATNVINIGIGNTVPTSFSGLAIQRNQWYTVEVDATLSTDTDTSADGTVDLFITKAGTDAATVISATQVGSLSQDTVTHVVLGIQDELATTSGTILFDNFMQDDARIYPTQRYSRSPVFTLSGHAFVGPGWIDGAALLTDEATNVMRLWDTDRFDTNSTQDFVLEFDIDNQTSYDGPLYFQKGCYVQLSGTNPRGQVFLSKHRLTHYNDAGVRRWGRHKG